LGLNALQPSAQVFSKQRAVVYNEMASTCRKNLWRYMHTHRKVPKGQQEKIWRPLFQRYNQSLRALKAGGFDVREEEYWECLRTGAEEYLKPAPQVLSGSLSLQARSRFAFCDENDPSCAKHIY
jgi:hypothetical protein